MAGPRPGLVRVAGRPIVPRGLVNTGLDTGVFTPADLAPTLWLPSSIAYQYQDSTGSPPGSTLVTATSQAVGAWRDRGSAGAHASQATAGQRPTVAQLAPSRVSFDGVDDNLSLSGTLVTSGSQSIAMRFLLRTVPGASTFYCPLRLSGTSAYTVVYLCNFAGYTSLTVLAGTTYSVSIAGCGVALTLDTSVHSLVITYNGGGTATAGSYGITYDGVAQTVATSSTSNRTSGQPSYLGCDASPSASLFAPVDLGDVVYDAARVWSAAEIASLSAYLGAN